MVSSFFFKLLLAQTAAAAIVIVILKKLLDRMLIRMAIRELEYGAAGDEKLLAATITSHKNLQRPHQDRIRQLVQKKFGASSQISFVIDKNIKGGLIIQLDNRKIDCSLRNRLHRAFSQS